MPDIILPPNAEETRRALLRKGVILIEGDVTKSMFDSVAGALCMLEAVGSPDVELRICSGGGNCHYSFAIYDALRHYKGKKTGFIIERAKSTATIIVQACDIRRIARHAEFLVHKPSVTATFTLGELESPAHRSRVLTSLRATNERAISIYMQRVKITRKELLKQLSKDENITSERALEMGFVDEIF